MILVTHLVDDNNPGSLRSAMKVATDGQTIGFDPSVAGKTMRLNSQIIVDKNITIDGKDAPGLKISGEEKTRIFEVLLQKTVTIRNLELINGETNVSGVNGAGAGIRVGTDAFLIAENCRFHNNKAAGWGGGAIRGGARSNVNCVNCTFEENEAIIENSERGGGAISTSGFATLTIRGCRFIKNRGINGGAINCASTRLVVEDSEFIENDAATVGAKLPGTASSPRGYGGAIYTDGVGTSSSGTVGEMVVQGCKFRKNRGAGNGGAVFLFGNELETGIVRDCLFEKNSVIPDAEGRCNGGGLRIGKFGQAKVEGSTFKGNQSEGRGGGVMIQNPSTWIENCSFSDNRSLAEGGGLSLHLVKGGASNCRFNDNYAQNQGGGLWRFGDSTMSEFVLTNCAFAGNSVSSASSGFAHSNATMGDGGGNIQSALSTPQNQVSRNATVK